MIDGDDGQNDAEGRILNRLVLKVDLISPPPPAEPKKDADIDELLKNMKGMPGMENIKMFTADDLKGMNPEQMAASMGGGGGGGRRRNWRRELVDFYTRYGLEDKIDGVDAALAKWKGRENKMMNALYKKYDAEIRAKTEAAKDLHTGDGDDAKEEL